MIKAILLGVVLTISLSGCIKSKTHEIKSPCVAIEPIKKNEFNVNPCIRRPANSNWLA